MHDLYIREFAADLDIRELADDGMLVEGLVVPFGIEADIVEPREDGVIRYREAFAPGSCDRAIRAPHWVSLTYNHSEDMPNRMGHGREFRESAEGLVGIFKLDATHAAQARDILTSSHRAFSVGFTSVVPRPMNTMSQWEAVPFPGRTMRSQVWSKWRTGSPRRAS